MKKLFVYLLVAILLFLLAPSSYARKRRTTPTPSVTPTVTPIPLSPTIPLPFDTLYPEESPLPTDIPTPPPSTIKPSSKPLQKTPSLKTTLGDLVLGIGILTIVYLAYRRIKSL